MTETLFDETVSRRRLSAQMGRLEQVAGVRLVQACDGSERGVRMLEFRTGSGFAFDVVVDRAFDIGRCELSGRAIGWQSATGFVGPWHAEHSALGFLRTFGGGLVTTCGLDHALFGATDDASQYGYPAKEVEAYGLHGRVSTIPARLVGYGHTWTSDDRCVLWAEGEVLQAEVFGAQLLLRRRIEAHVGASRLTILDEVVNVGWARTPHMFLYHVNIGYPVVDDGSELLLPAPNADSSAGPVPGYRTVSAPDPGAPEQVFEHELRADDDGWVTCGIVNPRLGFGAYQRFRKDQLPFHLVWRMLRSGNYVVGLEPSTNRLDGRLPARERGELQFLEHGETRRYSIEIGALHGEPELQWLRDRSG